MEMDLCSQSFCNEGDTSSVLSVRFSPLRTGQQLFQDLDDLACYRALGSIERVGAVLKAADACHEMWLKNGSHCATDEQWPDDTTNEYYTLSRAVRALREKPTEETRAMLVRIPPKASRAIIAELQQISKHALHIGSLIETCTDGR